MTKSTDLHDLITSIQDQHITNVHESQSPYVGIFYVVNGKLFWEGMPTRYVAKSGEYKFYPKIHVDYWEDIVIDYPKLGKFDPYHFPRGRVFFNIGTKKYHLVADRRITNDSKMVDKIISRMKLPKNNIVISNDDVHYS